MNKYFIFLLLLSFAFPTLKTLQVYAGGGVSAGGPSGGSGGNFVYCQDDSQKSSNSYQLLDYYDAQEPDGYNFQLDLGTGKTYQEMIEYVLKRLSKYDPYRAGLYKEWADQFIKETLFNNNGPVATPSNDLGRGYVLPPHCSIWRVISLFSSEEKFIRNTDKNYEVAASTWDQFDEKTKAGAILHEVAYREAKSYGATNSLAIRRFVGLISSANIESVDYSIEVLRAGLHFWGEPVNLHEKLLEDTEGMDVIPPAKNLIAWTIGLKEQLTQLSKGSLALQRRSVQSEKFTVTIEGQPLLCSGLTISRESNDRTKVIELYKRLTSANGITIDALDDNLISLNNCGNLRLKSSYFKNFEGRFDLMLRTDVGLTIARNKFYLERVLFGEVNGKDVSNSVCGFRGNQIECSIEGK